MDTVTASPAPESAALTAVVNTDAIAANTALVAERAGTGVIAVVKADGYGHGAVPAARAALAGGAAELGVAHVPEALALRAAGIDAHITSWLHTPVTDFGAAIAGDVDLALSSPRQLAAVVAAAREQGVTATISLKVDTGLGRSGIGADEWDEAARAVAAAQAEGAVRLRAMMCHLAFGDEPENPLNSLQAQRLDEASGDLVRLGVRPELMHLANSPSALTRPDLARDLVRPGIALYGYSPIVGRDFGLTPAMTLAARVALVKKVPAGQGISYSHTWTAPADTTIAVVPAGYADGVPRLLSGRIQVHINGRRFPNVGRICMDQLVVDLGRDGGGVREGDLAVLFGPPSPQATEPVPSATDWAEEIGTIDYEIVSGVGGRARRVYVGTAGRSAGDRDD